MASNSLAVVRALLNAGVDVNAYTTDGSTPLHFAAKFNALHLAEILLQNPLCDPEKLDADHNTPAKIAKEQGYTDLAKKLGYDEVNGDMLHVMEKPDSRAVSTGKCFLQYILFF